MWGKDLWCSFATGLVLAISVLTQDTQAAVSYRTVALTGDQAPGTDPGDVFGPPHPAPGVYHFNVPVINSHGHTAFRAGLTGPGVDDSNKDGIWSELSGSLQLITREGDAVADETGDLTVGSVYLSPVLNDQGGFIHIASVIGETVNGLNDSAIYLADGGGVQVIAREGDSAAGVGPGVAIGPMNQTSNVFHAPLLNASGRYAFGSGLTKDNAPQNYSAVWTGAGGEYELVTAVGLEAPGTEHGTVFSRVNNAGLNASGQVAVWGELTGTQIDNTNQEGVWIWEQGTLGLAARVGGPVPDAGPDAVISRLYQPSINDAGQLVFSGHVGGPGVDDTNNDAIWVGANGAYQLVARQGDPAPGAGAGVIYRSNYTTGARISGDGQVVFHHWLSGAGVDNTNDLGIWMGHPGDVRLVVREGDPSPGATTGAVFKELFDFTLNRAGQIIFGANISGPGIYTTNDFGLWAAGPDGEIDLIAREYGLFDVNDDPLIEDLRTIRKIAFAAGSNGEDGLHRMFNDAGQLSLRLYFTDGTEGVFVATVPEPGVFAVLGIGVPAVLRRR
jgi:hypothetical protein